MLCLYYVLWIYGLVCCLEWWSPPHGLPHTLLQLGNGGLHFTLKSCENTAVFSLVLWEGQKGKTTPPSHVVGLPLVIIPCCLPLFILPRCLLLFAVPRCLPLLILPCCLLLFIVPRCSPLLILPRCLLLLAVPRCLPLLILPRCLLLFTVPRYIPCC